MNESRNPYQAPELDRNTRMQLARRRRKLENIAIGIGVALFAFVLFWLPGIYRAVVRWLTE